MTIATESPAARTGTMRILTRLLFGFGALCAVLVVAVAVTLWQASRINDETDLLTNVRVPSVDRLNDVRVGVSDVIGSLRGYLLEGKQNFADERVVQWRRLDQARTQLDELVGHWTIASEIDDWRRLKGLLDQFHQAQDETVALYAQGKVAEANAKVATSLVPLIDQIQTILRGPADAQGNRKGGLIEKREFIQNETSISIQNHLHELLIFEVVLLIIGLLLSVTIALLTGRSVVRPIEGLRQAVARIAAGDANVTVPGAERGDETGDLARAIMVIRDAGVEALRIKVALDNVTSNVMMADNDFKIIYMNKAVLEMFRRAESDFRREMPHFDANKILGQNVDFFHRNPARQRDIAARMTGPYKSRFTLGGRTLDLVANPVINDKGERLGTAVEWRDITAELAVEQDIAGLVKGATEGDFSRRIDLAGKDGFTRILSDSINQLSDTTNNALNDIVGFLEALAAGDLTRRMTAQYLGMFARIKDDANTTTERLADIVNRIKGAADTIATASAEISAGSTDLSSRTEQQASSLEQTAASMEQLAATVRQNSENAQQANKLASGARDAAQTGGQVAGDAVAAMTRIEESSRKIADIIGVIDEIAFQTNLLALNAAVEAARAGDAGKGFAVVASEVRALAQRSAQASKEIKGLIKDSGTQVQEGVDLVRRAGDTLDGIVTSVKQVADIVAEIAAASSEQANGLEQVNIAVSQMDEMTQKNAALVEESAAAAHSLDEQSSELIQMIGFFHLNGDHQAAPRQASTGRPVARQAAKPVGPTKAPPPARKPATPVSRAKPDHDWKEF